MTVHASKMEREAPHAVALATSSFACELEHVKFLAGLAQHYDVTAVFTRSLHLYPLPFFYCPAQIINSLMLRFELNKCCVDRLTS